MSFLTVAQLSQWLKEHDAILYTESIDKRWFVTLMKDEERFIGQGVDFTEALWNSFQGYNERKLTRI